MQRVRAILVGLAAGVAASRRRAAATTASAVRRSRWRSTRTAAWAHRSATGPAASTAELVAAASLRHLLLVNTEHAIQGHILEAFGIGRWPSDGRNQRRSHVLGITARRLQLLLHRAELLLQLPSTIVRCDQYFSDMRTLLPSCSFPLAPPQPSIASAPHCRAAQQQHVSTVYAGAQQPSVDNELLQCADTLRSAIWCEIFCLL